MAHAVPIRPMASQFLRGHDPDLQLRCPVCGAPVFMDASFWRCKADSDHKYPDLAGVPVLLNPQRSMFRAEDFHDVGRTTFKQPPGWAIRLGRLLPSPSRDVSALRCQQRLAALLAARPADRRRVLVVGCGDGSVTYGALSNVEGSRWLETDVSLAGTAALVCDASDLPFEDGQFDLVICIAVLEHVLEPQRCVDEIHRVLATDGLVYATTPFMQQVHMGEYDFTRFTHSGHRWLLRGFDEIDSGVATGPASVMIWSVEYFLLSWSRSTAVRRIVKGGVRLLLGWMTLLDHVLAKKLPAHDAAGGFYFVGRRSSAAVMSARAMIRYYRGSDTEK